MSTAIEERLYSIRYKVADESHLHIKENDVCLHCALKPCTSFCPADVYEWTDSEKIIRVAYENCVECGTCRIGCPEDNIRWEYPTGGCGISYRFG